MKREMKVKGTGSWCVFVEYVKDNDYRGFMILGIIGTKKNTLLFTRREILTKSMERDM